MNNGRMFIHIDAFNGVDRYVVTDHVSRLRWGHDLPTTARSACTQHRRKYFADLIEQHSKKVVPNA